MLLRFKAMLTLKAFLHSYHFVFVFPSCYLSKGFGGVLQKMATQGCCFNARSATTKLSRDSAVLYQCTNRLKNSLWTLKVMNSINCTPANQLYCCMVPDRHWTLAAGLVVRGSLLCPVWCERCLLITESPKTPGHYRYLIWVLELIVSCFLHPNPSHIVVVCHVWCLYVFQLQSEHLFVVIK